MHLMFAVSNFLQVDLSFNARQKATFNSGPLIKLNLNRNAIFKCQFSCWTFLSKWCLICYENFARNNTYHCNHSNIFHYFLFFQARCRIWSPLKNRWVFVNNSRFSRVHNQCDNTHFSFRFLVSFMTIQLICRICHPHRFFSFFEHLRGHLRAEHNIRNVSSVELSLYENYVGARRDMQRYQAALNRIDNVQRRPNAPIFNQNMGEVVANMVAEGKSNLFVSSDRNSMFFFYSFLGIARGVQAAVENMRVSESFRRDASLLNPVVPGKYFS